MATHAAWLGIDVGGSSTKLALCDGSGAMLATAQSTGYRRPSAEALAEAVRMACDQLGVDGQREHIAGVGLAVPGPVEAGQAVLPHCGNLPALAGLNASGWVQSCVGRAVPVRLLTDQLATATAEWHADPRPGRTLVLTLGTGVGGAVLDDGVPLTFTRGTPGHLGHLDISGGSHNAPATAAAGRGALEAYLGAPALRALGLPLEDPEACAAHKAMPDVIGGLARGLRIMFGLYRMDHIILAGGVAPVFGPVLDQLEQRIRDGLTPVAPEDWTLRVGEVGLYAGAIGAARLAQEARPV